MAPQPAITLGGLLAQRAASHAHHTALQWDGADPRWQRLDYATLAERAHAMARALPVERGLRVAWLGFNHPAQLVLLFALGLRGAVLVPLNYRLAPAEWATILDDCAPLLLLHDDAFAEPARALAAAEGLQAVAIESLDLTPDEPVVDQGRASDAALIVYTSGTTGDPKGAVHTQANLLANMAIAAQVQAMSAHDSVLTALPLFHVGGLCIQTLPALSMGARVLLHRRFDPGAVLDTIARERPTLTLQVPATLQALLQHPHWSAVDLSCLRAIWAGSSLLPAELLRACHARGVPVCNVYGSTETGPFSIALGPDRAMELVGSCGWPAPGVEVKLVDEQGEPVARGRVGEICVRAPNVAQLYWPDVDAVDSEGFFHSGDLARQEAEGHYVVVGRSKDMIISGGENIYPAEIEQLLAEHPWVAECAVVGRPDERWGEVCVAVVVLRETAPVDDWTSGVEASLHGRLARYKWPRMWHRVDALPRTALGKVVKPAIRAWLVSQR
ncbi:class I adenylate-forming enzyme family protein [Hydrogenophaga intermedia]|uniref:class I adenylate-forming enzyme family protein n=1 Tax=Hydrogenophaga intermedia TaxID=65786 RepID=UPI002042E700|nr:AMP-binding protein [Hydrogenophaga intermedia]MCM3563607.1 AMP-binding protein [Hydrogenophaga intermedia]